MRIFIFIVFGVTAALTALLAVAPWLLVIAALSFMVVGPLGFVIVGPLLAIPSIALYSSLFLPAAIASPGSSGRWGYVAAGLVAAAALAVGLPFVSQQTVKVRAGGLASNDVAAPPSSILPPMPHLIELLTAPARNAKLRSAEPHERAPCGALCQTILAEHLADQVRISYVPQGLPPNTQPLAQATYTLAQTASCRPILPGQPTPLPVTTAALAEGYCFIVAPEPVGPATLTFSEQRLFHEKHVSKYEHRRMRQYKRQADRLEARCRKRPSDNCTSRVQRIRNRIKPLHDATFMLDVTTAKRFEVFAGSGSTPELISRRTSLSARPLGFPLLLVPEATFNGYGRDGLFFLRTKQTRNDYTFETEVLYWLEALKQGRWPDPAKRPAPLVRYQTIQKRLEKRYTPDPATLIRKLLARPGSEPFGAGANQVLRTWAATLRKNRQLSDADHALVSAMLRDRRFIDISTFANALRRFAPQLTSDIPAMIDRLETPVPNGRGHTQNAVGYLLTQMPIDSIRPHADRIIRIVEANDQWPMNGVLPIVGQFGRDTSALLRARLQSSRDSTARAAIVGICRADPAVAQPLLPELVKRLESLGVTSPRNRYYIKSLARALIRHGRAADVQRILDETADTKKRGRALRHDLARGAGFDPKYCG